MINKIVKLPFLKKVLHIDMMCNAGPYWVRQIAGMSESYLFVDSSNPKFLPQFLTYNPTHIVLGGGFWNSKAQEKHSDLLNKYLNAKKGRCFGYWGDGTMSLINEPVADIVFCSSVNAVNKFKQLKTHAEYAPHPVESELYYDDPSIEKIYDWNFIGTNYGTTRQRQLDMLRGLPYNGIIRGQGHVPKTLTISFEQTANVFRQSKITININDDKYLNLNKYFSDRLLMAMFCKSLVLTTWQPGLESIFIPGKHLDTFKTDEELVEKLGFYLENPDKVKEIVDMAYNSVQQYSIQNMIAYFFQKTQRTSRMA